MTDETNNENNADQEVDLPLRDRIVKIETTMEFHDREFRDIKDSMNNLSNKVDQNQSIILSVIEEHSKKTMDAQYTHYRDTVTKNAEIVNAIQENKNAFNTFLNKWKFGVRAVWIAIIITISVGVWAFDVAQGLGIFSINPIQTQSKTSK